ncbi:hypothetical protein [Azospirillum doebereinerae]|uniref:Uncharacterized protein n=1 Tax=Azospirillum doebereinerae TaxID=92933 RepID=A0A3S0V3H8_9PROT|nr:hypothetical protein [Azospirillum doebereinerae]RUQ65160.1 hypothetical protein EJ913_25790 [Azospirillum doebereinerae]
MAHNPETTVRKIFTLPKDLWEKVENYRFESRAKTEAEAMRVLIEYGLRFEDHAKLANKEVALFGAIISSADVPDEIKKQTGELMLDFVKALAKTVNDFADAGFYDEYRKALRKAEAAKQGEQISGASTGAKYPNPPTE